MAQKSSLNKNGELDKLAFNEFLNKLGVFLATQEIRNAFCSFDKD